MAEKLDEFQKSYDRITNGIQKHLKIDPEEILKDIKVKEDIISKRVGTLKEIIAERIEENKNKDELKNKSIISEYEKQSDIKSFLSDIKRIAQDMSDQAKVLTTADKECSAKKSDLVKLKADIAKDLKTRDKKSKSLSAIKKLSDDIDSDLKKISSISSKLSNVDKRNKLGVRWVENVLLDDADKDLRTKRDVLVNFVKKDLAKRAFDQRSLTTALNGIRGRSREFQELLSRYKRMTIDRQQEIREDISAFADELEKKLKEYRKHLAILDKGIAMDADERTRIEGALDEIEKIQSYYGRF